MNVDLDHIERLIGSTPERRGWDFSRVRSHIDPTPWDYLELCESWLDETDHVLDLDTGGGEKFIGLAAHFGTGVGTDSSADQIAVCQENLPAHLAGKVTFVETDARDLMGLSDESFDKVLNRHGVFSLTEVWRVLKPGGVFLTQQVGDRNTLNVFQAFGYEDAADYWKSRGDSPRSWDDVERELEESSFQTLSSGEYNVDYYFDDVESFVFWLKAVEIPYPIEAHQHSGVIAEFISANTTKDGIKTNEHRRLLVLRRPRPV